jgi:hypothetical protein
VKPNIVVESQHAPVEEFFARHKKGLAIEHEAVKSLQ